MFQPGNGFGDGLSLCDVHQSEVRGAEGALQEHAVQLTRKHRDVDFACHQRIDCLAAIQVHKMRSRIQCVGRSQNL